MSVIMLIDDDESICKICRLVLERKEYTVYTFETVPETIDNVRKVKPDLIISDFNLPDYSNGVDLVEDIREKILKNPDLPAFIITGNPVDNKQIIKKAGFKMLAKPFNPEQLLRLVSKLLK